MAKRKKVSSNPVSMENANVTTATANTARQTVYLTPAQIIRGENFGRYKSAPPDAVKELATSIKEHGQLNPVLVRTKGDEYHLVAGFTRVGACELLGVPVWCEIVDITEQHAIDKSIEENWRRNDLTLIDKAAIMKRLKDRGDSQREIGARLGCSGPWVNNCMKLLTLPTVIQDCIAEGKLTGQAGIALTKLKDEDDIMAVFTSSLYTEPDPENPKKVLERYDAGKIMKEVEKRVKPAETSETTTSGEGETTTTATDGETTTTATEGKKSTVRTLFDDFVDVTRRALNDAPMNPEFRVYQKAVIDFLTGNLNREGYETALADYAGFKTTDLYKGDEA